MPKFYVLLSSFSPNTATTNRYLGMLKEFSKKKINTDVIFFMSDDSFSKAPELPYINYHYYWKYLPVKSNKLKFILYLYVYSYLFLFRLKKGDKVYVYACDPSVKRLTRKAGIEVYQERTECPDVSHVRFLNLDKYYISCKKLTGLFVISQGLKDFYISKGVDASRIHIINMTVDASRFENIVKQPSERYIAYCGKATNNKDGVDQLIKAFAITVKTHPDVKLYIIGVPPKKTDASGNLELVEALGIQKQVVFTGTVQAKDIPQLLKNAEILALDRPDNIQAKYGFPTKLGEYLLTCNPVVISDVGDIKLFLKNGVSALIAKPDCPENFASKLNWALDNPHDAAKIGFCGSSVALREFDSKKESCKILNKIFDLK